MKIKQLIICLFVAALTVSAFSGCGGNKDPGSDSKKPGTDTHTADKTISDKKIQYTFFAHNWNSYNGQENDRILKHLEEKFNIKINITGAPESGYNDKLNALINSGSTPDLILMQMNNEGFYRFIDNEIMLPIDPYLSDETPTLKAFYETEQYSNLNIGTYNYFLPLITEPSGHALFVRRDWMNNLGISDPKTIDEFTAMLKAFTENDPDKNGAKDTFGWTMSKSVEWLRDFVGSFGVTSEWTKSADGTWGMDVLTDEYQNFIAWLNGLYKNGYLKNEFYLHDNSVAVQDFVTGRAGVLLQTSGGGLDSLLVQMKSADPNAKVDILQMPEGVAPGGFTDFGGTYGGWSISSEAEEPYRLIKLLDYLISPEGQDLRYYGLKDIHYTVEADGSYKPNLTERGKEGGRFLMNSGNVPGNAYALGQFFSIVRYSIENKQLVRHFDYSSFDNPELVKKSIQFQSEKMNKKEPWNVFDFSMEFLRFRIRSSEKCETILIKAVSGQTPLSEVKDVYLAELNTLGYAQSKEEMNEVMTKLGR